VKQIMEDTTVERTQTVSKNVVAVPTETRNAVVETTETVRRDVQTGVAGGNTAVIDSSKTVVTNVAEPSRPPGRVTTVTVSPTPEPVKRTVVSVAVKPGA
jgi:hypothetical protein